MINWLMANIGTIIIAAIIAGILAAVVVKLVRDKKSGKCPGCECASCPKSSDCKH
ncbi:MAG: FeoB-associated Cys-rich membrane protein [Oscillospiraceae bacterium]|jgi:fructose-specific phosphotransferase system IIC component|nr:FeoB-associated Cys-rich membrane protein [Oscillospiraceae bacterium]